MSNVVPLDKQFKDQAEDVVVTYDNSDIFTPIGAFGRRYNPDDLINKRGIHTYAQMINDEQVKAVCEFKMNAILGRGWEFYFDEDCDLSEEERELRTNVFKCAIRKMKGSFHDVLDGIGSGREFGFSVSEKIYSTMLFKGKAYKGLNKIVIRNPDSFEFYTDEFGELTKIEQRGYGTGKKIQIDPAKLIHYVHKPKWDVVYGRSDLRAAYRSWYCKDTIIKLWVLYIEKFGGGIIVGKKTPEANISSGTPADIALQNAFKSIQSLKSILLPPGVECDIHFPTSGNVHKEAIEFFDLAIAKSLLVPNLLGLSHTGQTGAFAQSQTQLEAFYWTLLMDANRLADTVNEQLFKDLGDQNWGDGEYPLFRFKKASLDQIKWIVETWQKLVGSSVVINTEEDEKFLRNLMDMPVRTEDSIELVSESKQRQMDLEEEVARAGIANTENANKPEVQAAIEKVIKEVLSIKDKIEAAANQRGDVIVNNEISAPAVESNLESQADSDKDVHAGAEIHFHGPLINCTSEMARKASSRVAFAVIGKRTEDLSLQSVDEIAAILTKAVKKALGNDEEFSALIDDDSTDVARFELAATDVGKLKAQYNTIVRRGWQLGSDHARNEIHKSRADASVDTSLRITAAALREKAASYFDNQAFRMAGDTSDQTKKIIQQELQNGIKFTKPTEEVRANIWNRLVEKGLTKRQIVRGIETEEAVNKALDALWQDTVEGAAAYLNTLVRTNMFEALNEARYSEFTDPALADFIVGLQYAAVLDSSVTEICYELGTEGPDGDGVIYNADSPLWDTYRPPNHFNCRSILVPITVNDGWDGEESDEPISEPAEGFE